MRTVLKDQFKEQMKERIRSTAEEINAQAQDLKVAAFLSLLYTSDVIAKYIDMEFTHLPISRSAFNILFNLTLKGGSMMPTDISKAVLRSKHSVTKVLDTLEKQGYVKRLSNNIDRRVKSIVITTKGINLVKKDTTATRERMSHMIFSGMEEKKIVELNKNLEQVRNKALNLIEGNEK
jgi:MarR family transcriptional regulator, organic hydroperoxide resistance regulator